MLWDLPILFVYLDYILIVSTSTAEHLTLLQTLFEWLSQHCLIVNPAKCQFSRISIDFLGHCITKDGAVPLPSKVAALADFQRSLTVRALQEFWGRVYF